MSSSTAAPSGRVRVVGKAIEGDPDTTTAGSTAFPTARTTRAQIEKSQAQPADSTDSDESEDACYLCGLGGEVLVCDEKGCGKVYHTLCLGREPAASERFTCPQHYCCVCGVADRSVSHKSDMDLTRCTTCPSAFCAAHKPDGKHFAKLPALTRPATLPNDLFESVFVPGTAALDKVQGDDMPASAAKRARLLNENGGTLSVTTMMIDAEGKSSEATPLLDVMASPSTDPAAAGKKRRRPNELQKILEGKQPNTPEPETPATNQRARSGPAPSVYRCNNCLYPTAHQRLAKRLEQVLVSVVTARQPHNAKVLTPLLSDQVTVPIYVANGHVHSSLQMEVRQVVAACSTSQDSLSAGAEVHSTTKSSRVAPQRKELFRFAAMYTAEHVKAALQTGEEACLVPSVPCCIGDILAVIRSCKYSTVEEFQGDLHQAAAVIAQLTQSYNSLAIVTDTESARVEELEKASKRAPKTPSTPLAAETPKANSKTSSSAYSKPGEGYADAFVTFIKQIERAMLSKRFRDILAEAQRDCAKASCNAAAALETLATIRSAVSPLQSYAEAWSTARADEPEFLQRLLDSELKLSDNEALIRLYSLRLSSLHPELSWSWSPYKHKRVSLIDAYKHITDFPVSRKAGATQALELVTQRALQSRRRSILTGFGSNSSRWNTNETLTFPAIGENENGKEDHGPSDSSDSDADSSSSSSTIDVPEVAEGLKQKFSEMATVVEATKRPFDRPFAMWGLRVLRIRKGEKAASQSGDTTAAEEYEGQVKSVMEWARALIPPEERPRNRDRDNNGSSKISPRNDVTSSPQVSSLMGLGGAATSVPLAALMTQIGSPIHAMPPIEETPSWVSTLRDAQAQLLESLESATGSDSATTAGGGDVTMSVTTRSAAALDTSGISLLHDSSLPEHIKPLLSVVRSAASAPSSDKTTPLLLNSLLEQHIQQQKRDAQMAALSSSVTTLANIVIQQQAALEQTRQAFATLKETKGTAPRAVTTDAEKVLNSYLDLAGDNSVRSGYLVLHPKERHAVSVLTEMAPQDVDGGIENLAEFLPPSEGEVSGLLDDMSTHLRRAMLTQAELRSAWTASKRALMSFPAPVGVEKKLLVPAFADIEPEWVDTDPALEDDGSACAVLTLGEGRAAAELMLANKLLRERCDKLEALVTAHALASQNNAKAS